MHPKFRENLEYMNHIAKKDLDVREDDDDQMDETLGAVLQYHIEAMADARDSSDEAGQEIYEMQRQKQRIMQEYKESVDRLDTLDEYADMPPNGIMIKMEGDILQDQEGNQITKGDIFTDGAWGIEYALDPDTVPRNIRKRYLLEKAKSDIIALANEQIVTDKVASKRTDEYKKHAYKEITKEENAEQAGVLAEKMVQSYFKRIMHNHPELEFEIREADVQQDIDQKIDFIVKRKNHLRGVGVDAQKDTVGLQFTINTSREALHRKQRQAKKAKEYLSDEDIVEDIMLVVMPMRDVNNIYNNWKEDRASGGPEKLLPEATQKKLFEKILGGIMSSKKIAESWEAVHGTEFYESVGKVA